MEFIKRNFYILFIIFASVITRFIYFGYPTSTVFDEVHFGKFISGYFTGEYFFDIHPPLAKLLLSLMGYIGGFVPGFSFAEIGQSFSDNTYLWLRFLPSLAGAILPIIIYFLAKKLKLSNLTSFLIACLIIFDGGLLVQSRFILLDSFLLLFGFTSFLSYAHFKESRKIKFFILAIILATFAVSVKWTGISFLGIIGVLELIDLIRLRKFQPSFVRLALFLIAPVIYASFFVVHIYLLPNSGQGDPFMTPEFQKNLIGNQYQNNSNIQGKSLLSGIVEINKEMYRANRDLTAPHPYASKWYSWPFVGRPIYYWHKDSGFDASGQKLDSRIYFIGNPISWWLATIAILYILIEIVPRSENLRELKNYIKNRKIQFLLLGGYLVNMLPFVGIDRAMFLYHYMPALVFSYFSLGWLSEQFNNKKVQYIIIALVILSFIFFSPIIYGNALTSDQFHWRIWFKIWE